MGIRIFAKGEDLRASTSGTSVNNDGEDATRGRKGGVNDHEQEEREDNARECEEGFERSRFLVQYLRNCFGGRWEPRGGVGGSWGGDLSGGSGCSGRVVRRAATAANSGSGVHGGKEGGEKGRVGMGRSQMLV